MTSLLYSRALSSLCVLSRPASGIALATGGSVPIPRLLFKRCGAAVVGAALDDPDSPMNNFCFCNHLPSSPRDALGAPRGPHCLYGAGMVSAQSTGALLSLGASRRERCPLVGEPLGWGYSGPRPDYAEAVFSRCFRNSIRRLAARSVPEHRIVSCDAGMRMLV